MTLGGLQGEKLAHLPAGIPVNCVRPHRHRACVHLLAIFSLEISGASTVGEGSPTFRLCEPLRTILCVYLRALEAHQLHSAAINIAHGLPQWLPRSVFRRAILRWNNEKKRQRC
jgi:hypothetical protein